MTTLYTWPQLGTTVTLASGYVITATGAEFTPPTDEAVNLVSAGRLVTKDPTGVNPFPLPIPTPSFGGVSVATADLLSVLPGIFDGQTATLLGYYAPGDGGGGDFRWSLLSPLAADGGLVFGASFLGKWIRTVDATLSVDGTKLRSTYINVRWFGARGDNFTPDQSAFQNALAHLGGFGGKLYVPGGAYLFTDTVYCKNALPAFSPSYNLEVVGDNHGAGGLPSTQFVWGGAATGAQTGSAGTGYATNNGSVMWQAGVPCSTYKSIWFTVSGGYHVGCLVNVGNTPGGPQYVTKQSFEKCSFDAPAVGMADFLVAFDYFNLEAGNNENHSFLDCGTNGGDYAQFWFRENIQPFNVRWEGGSMNSFLHTTPNNPHGVGVLCDTGASDFTFKNVDFQRLACHFYARQMPTSTTWINCSSEQYKKIAYFQNGQGNNVSVMSIHGGRYDGNGQTQQAQGALLAADPNFAASDHNIIDVRGDFPVHITACHFGGGYNAAEGFFRWDSGDMIVEGCRLYSADWIRKRNNTWVTNCNGRTYSKGNYAPGAGVTEHLPTLSGCLNPGGTVTITGAATTTANVVFANPEPTNYFNGTPIGYQDYKVALTIMDATSGAIITEPFVSAILSTGFTINVSTAPGASKTLTIAYELSR